MAGHFIQLWTPGIDSHLDMSCNLNDITKEEEIFDNDQRLESVALSVFNISHINNAARQKKPDVMAKNLIPEISDRMRILG